MLKRQTSGSVVCPSCGKLVGVNDPKCWSCGRLYPGMWGYAPLLRNLGRDLGFAKLTLTGCAALYIATLLFDPGGIAMGGLLRFASPSGESLYTFGAAGAIPVLRDGRWWTLLSAGWLHGGLLHIGFNMYWLNMLAPPVAEIYGAGRMVVIYTAASVLGFLLSSWSIVFPGFLSLVMGGGAGLTIGASAAIFGLLGALVYSGKRGGSSHVARQAWTYAIILFIFVVVLVTVAMLTLLDTPYPEDVSLSMLDRIAIRTQDIKREGTAFFIRYIKWRIEWERQRLRERNAEPASAEQFHSREVQAAFMRALSRYQAKAYDGQVLLLRPRQRVAYRLPDGRVLIAQRPAGKAMAGLWEFPGGKVADGETPEAALIRELEEEIGIDTEESCLAPLTFASHRYESFHLLMPLYVCRVWRGTPVAREGQALKWVRPAALRDYPMPPADVPLVALLRDLL